MGEWVIIIRSNPCYIFTTHSGIEDSTKTITEEGAGSNNRYDMVGWYDVIGCDV